MMLNKNATMLRTIILPYFHRNCPIVNVETSASKSRILEEACQVLLMLSHTKYYNYKVNYIILINLTT